MLATLSPRCSPAVKNQSRVPPRDSVAVASLCHAEPRYASLSLQDSVPQRIVTYHNGAETRPNVVHAFCSRSVTLLLRCSHVVLRCITLSLNSGELRQGISHTNTSRVCVCRHKRFIKDPTALLIYQFVFHRQW